MDGSTAQKAVTFFIFALHLGYIEDFHENLKNTNISACFKVTRNEAGQDVYNPISSQGILAKNLLDKREQRFLIQLHTPFSSMRSFLPSGIDYGLRIHLTEGELNMLLNVFMSMLLTRNC